MISSDFKLGFPEEFVQKANGYNFYVCRPTPGIAACIYQVGGYRLTIRRWPADEPLTTYIYTGAAPLVSYHEAEFSPILFSALIYDAIRKHGDN